METFLRFLGILRARTARVEPYRGASRYSSGSKSTLEELMVSLVDKEKWAHTVGMFILAMGSIEHAASQCLREWSAYKAKETLSSRLGSVSKLVPSKNLSKETTLLFQQAIEDASSLLGLRNVIAHQPLALRIFDPDNSPPLLEGFHDLEKTQRSYSLDDIADATRTAETVSDRLHQGMAQFRRENPSQLPSFWSKPLDPKSKARHDR